MKLGQAAKLDKKNMATLKKIDDDVMSANSDVIVVFPIYGWFGAIWKPDFGGMVCRFWTNGL